MAKDNESIKLGGFMTFIRMAVMQAIGSSPIVAGGMLSNTYPVLMCFLLGLIGAGIITTWTGQQIAQEDPEAAIDAQKLVATAPIILVFLNVFLIFAVAPFVVGHLITNHHHAWMFALFLVPGPLQWLSARVEGSIRYFIYDRAFKESYGQGYDTGYDNALSDQVATPVEPNNTGGYESVEEAQHKGRRVGVYDGYVDRLEDESLK